MHNGLWNYVLYLLFTLPLLTVYVVRWKRKEAAARAALEKGQLFSEGPKAQHPRIDVLRCIGCGCCVEVCPEGDVLGLVGGRSAIINGYKCIGHGLCKDACPVGALDLVMASPGMQADMPCLTAEYETSIDNLFIVGELGGLALIKNAINEGRDCVDTITTRLALAKDGQAAPDAYDVCVVGAGPGGISASLRAVENRISCVTIDQDDVGGTVAKYPRQKLVMTSPARLPIYGNFRKLEITKEDLMTLWMKIIRQSGMKVNSGEKVENITKGEDRVFTIESTKSVYRARFVILALGRRGTPRKLGIPGEELPKVMYSLIEAHAYRDAKILVVGGGDSAIEAAMGLAQQQSNQVTLSYRKSAFSRIKDRNARRIREFADARKIDVVFNSNPVEVRAKSVFLDVGGEIRAIENDYVWVFAGGTPPNAFLEKIGVKIGTNDLTREARAEVMKARDARCCGAIALEAS